MKHGLHSFTLSDSLISAYKEKYGHTALFIRINGCLEDRYYKKYRDVQKQIIKQILTSFDLKYSSKNVSINMSVDYEDEDIRIHCSDWIPHIEVEYQHPQYGRTRYTISLGEVYLNNTLELVVY